MLFKIIKIYNNGYSKKIVMAFTLAEVLITLLIVGIIASIIIPDIISDTQEQEFKVAKKKAFGAAAQAYINAISENGGGFGEYGCGHHTKFPAIKAQLNVVKTCNGNSFDNCWASNGVLPYATGGCFSGFGEVGQNANTTFITDDGMSWMHYTSCDIIAIDVNGAKGPNRWGKDAFAFEIRDTYLKPNGCDPAGKNSITFLYE